MPVRLYTLDLMPLVLSSLVLRSHHLLVFSPPPTIDSASKGAITIISRVRMTNVDGSDPLSETQARWRRGPSVNSERKIFFELGIERLQAQEIASCLSALGSFQYLV